MGTDSFTIIEDKEIGRITFVRTYTARSLKIIIRPFKSVRVSVPLFISIESAGRFVEEKRPWIRKSQLRLARFEKKGTLFTEATVFTTRDHNLILEKHDRSTIRTVIGGGEIRVLFPDYADVTDPRIQKAVRKAIHQAWRIEARKYLPEMLHHLAIQNNLSYGKITVRDNKTRWGSCSGGNNISLNIHLVRLPQHLCRYVILHELAHIVHKHHQKGFWQYLDQLTGGRARELDRELNGFSPSVW